MMSLKDIHPIVFLYSVMKWWWRLHVFLMHWPLTWSDAVCFMNTLHLTQCDVIEPSDLLTCSFSPAVVDILSLSPWCLPIPSALAVTPLLLSDGLFCCLKHLIGGQVYIIRGEFSLAAFISIGCCSSIFLFSCFLSSSSILVFRLANTSTWMLKVWPVENLSAN